MQYWVYLWACQYGAYRDSEIQVFAPTAFDALLAAMQHHRVAFAVEAIVVPVGSYEGETFRDVSLVLV